MRKNPTDHPHIRNVESNDKVVELMFIIGPPDDQEMIEMITELSQENGVSYDEMYCTFGKEAIRELLGVRKETDSVFYYVESPILKRDLVIKKIREAIHYARDRQFPAFFIEYEDVRDKDGNLLGNSVFGEQFKLAIASIMGRALKAEWIQTFEIYE